MFYWYKGTSQHFQITSIQQKVYKSKGTKDQMKFKRFALVFKCTSLQIPNSLLYGFPKSSSQFQACEQVLIKKINNKKEKVSIRIKFEYGPILGSLCSKGFYNIKTLKKNKIIWIPKQWHFITKIWITNCYIELVQ